MKTSCPLLSLLALATHSFGQTLPYNPTRILTTQNSSIGYIFRPSASDPAQHELLTLDYSKSISTSTVFKTLYDKLPFFADGSATAYTPAIASDGNITVVAGDCSTGAAGAAVWTYVNAAGNGDWSEYNTTSGIQGVEVGTAGANFLSAGISFSQDVDGSAADTGTYVFGGMCPTSDTTASTWVSAADYSSSLVSVLLDGSAEGYDLSIVANSGPPIAQAGATLTGLTPTYSLDTSGDAQRQQQDFVLLGGQTQTAFINTSQVALFALPQSSWSFVPVLQPSAAKTDLAARQITDVTPRSGHTAVLSEDGNSLIVFGGWVGDTSMPAQPQLAVLNFGSGYGGNGEWSWSVPQQLGDGLPSGSGIYGHGAAMLPGGVMMVLGGFQIPATSSKRIRRDARTANPRTLLYNVTSNSWIDSYNPPANLTQTLDDQNGSIAKKSQEVGLGAGLGVGAALLVTVVGFYFWYDRRLKRARRDRERALLISSDGSSSVRQLDQPFLNGGGIDGRGDDEAAVGRYWPNGGLSSSYPHAPEMQHTTGMWVNVPSPTRGLRKGGSGKGYLYQPAPRYDDKRMSRGSGHIHPIAEHENEDGSQAADDNDGDSLTDVERKLKEVERVLNSDDPFTDPEPNPLGSHPVSPEIEKTIQRVLTGASQANKRPLSGEMDVPNWTIEGSQHEHLIDDDNGRHSPSKTDERTSSTLSERSTQSSSSITRTMSNRTGAILAAAIAQNRNSMSHEISPIHERTNTMSTDGGRKSPFSFKARPRSSTNGSSAGAAPNSAGLEEDSFMVAKSNFVHLQSEGEALLGGRPAADRDDPYQRALAAHDSTRSNHTAPLGAMPRSTTSGRQRQGWMGSLRRALNAIPVGDRSFSFTSTTTEPYKDDPRTSNSSPTREGASGERSAPRRAVSDGGAWLKQKRGLKDWAPYRDDPDPGDWGEPKAASEVRQAEEDWDVEGAASKRDVQVMFTVPKSRLRVVNDDMDRASLRSASDGAVSRAGSLKNLRREESLKGMRARSDGDKSLLPPTEEEDIMKEKAA